MSNTNQPTATAFARSQQSWAEHLLAKVDADITERESYLRNERGYSVEQLDEDKELIDLYEDSIFYERYAKEMSKQREFLRNKYFGGQE